MKVPHSTVKCNVNASVAANGLLSIISSLHEIRPQNQYHSHD